MSSYSTFQGLDNFLKGFMKGYDDQRMVDMKLSLAKQQNEREQQKLHLEQQKVQASIQNNQLMSEMKLATQQQTQALNQMKGLDLMMKIQDRQQETAYKDAMKQHGSQAIHDIVTSINTGTRNKTEAIMNAQSVIAQASTKYGIKQESLQNLVDPILDSMLRTPATKTHQIMGKAPDGTKIVSFVTDLGDKVGEFKTGEMAAEVTAATNKFVEQEAAIRKSVLDKIMAAGTFYSKSKGSMINIGEFNEENQEEREQHIYELARTINERVELEAGPVGVRADKYFSRLIPDPEARKNWVQGLNLVGLSEAEYARLVSKYGNNGETYDSMRAKYWTENFTKAGMLPNQPVTAAQIADIKTAIENNTESAEDKAIALSIFNQMLERVNIEEEPETDDYGNPFLLPMFMAGPGLVREFEKYFGGE